MSASFQTRRSQIVHQTLLAGFERMNAEGDAWMSRMSANDADVLIGITAQPREAVSVYWFDNDDRWTSLSGTRVAGQLDGVFRQIYYDRVRDITWSEPGYVRINGCQFWIPEAMKDKAETLLREAITCATQYSG